MTNCVEQCWGYDGNCTVELMTFDGDYHWMDCDDFYDYGNNHTDNDTNNDTDDCVVCNVYGCSYTWAGIDHCQENYCEDVCNGDGGYCEVEYNWTDVYTGFLRATKDSRFIANLKNTENAWYADCSDWNNYATFKYYPDEDCPLECTHEDQSEWYYDLEYVMSSNCTDCDGQDSCLTEWYEGNNYYFQNCSDFDGWYDCWSYGDCSYDNDTDHNDTDDCPEFICYDSDCTWQYDDLMSCNMTNCVEQCWGYDGNCTVELMTYDGDYHWMDCDDFYNYGNNDTDNDTDCPEYTYYESDCAYWSDDFEWCTMTNVVEQCYGNDGWCEVSLKTHEMGEGDYVNMTCDVFHDWLDF
jgi:hypothetical protein